LLAWESFAEREETVYKILVVSFGWRRRDRRPICLGSNHGVKQWQR